MTGLMTRRNLIMSMGGCTICAGMPSPAVSNRSVPQPPEPIVQPVSGTDIALIERAFKMRQRAIENGDQAYGAVVARDGIIIGQSWSRVIVDQDPTAHAEMSALRDASRRIGNRHLNGSVLYSSSKACPMCEAAAYWAGIERMVFGRNADDSGAPRLCG